VAGGRDYCFRHRKMYEGWQCPECLDEKETGQTGRAGKLSETPHSMEEQVAARHREEAAGQPSRVESQAKLDEAQRMLSAGALDQAFELARQATVLDRTNFLAQFTAARMARMVHDGSAEQEFLENAIDLLRLPEFRASIACYLDLLKQVQGATQLSRVVHQFISARSWPARDAISVIRLLGARQATADALRVLEAVPVRERSLFTAAYAVHVSGRPSMAFDAQIEAYLPAVPASRRDEVLAEYREICQQGTFSDFAMMVLRDALRTKYAEWEADIGTLMRAEAREVATPQLGPKVTGPALLVAGGAFAFLLVAGGILTLIVGGGAPMFLMGLILAVAGGGGGFAYGREHQIRKELPAILPQILEALANGEYEQWKDILDDEANRGSSRAPEPPARDTPAEPDVAFTSMRMKTCPFCGVLVAEDATSCPQCWRTYNTRPSSDTEKPADEEAPASARQVA